jgi:ribulose-bisphosphate carboxylase large chain
MGDDRIQVWYRLSVGSADAAARAQALALEQSIEMPAEAVSDATVLATMAGRVEALEPQPDGSTLARISLASASVGDDAGQLMNMLFGNCSLQPDVELVDLELPAALARHFGGPNLGIDGLRRLTGADGRPLTCTALKPIGSSPAHLAALCTSFAQAGVDLIKDDHGWADQAAAPFAERVAACQRAVDAVNATRRGTRTLYAPSLFGAQAQMRASLAAARAAGVKVVLIAPMICGVATLVALKREFSDIAFLAHPALGGNARIAPPLLLGKLFRLFGADAVIFPNHGGRFIYSRSICDAIARNCRAPWHELKPALPVPAGGMTVERVPELLRDYGKDAALLIGGSLLAARDDLAARSRAFVQAVGP